MQDDRKSRRETQIETAALGVLLSRGYEATSMLSVAKAAQASNQTLYKWYGDKRGLFAAIVRANASDARARLEAAIAEANTGRALGVRLREIGRVLLGMLLAERAVALNRAAASDASGVLGQVIAEAGRAEVLPMISALMAQEPNLARAPDDAAELFVRLLIGDTQLRRVIGAMAPLSEEDLSARVEQACEDFLTLALRAP